MPTFMDEQERQELAAEIEWAYIRAPFKNIVMLECWKQNGKSCAAGKILLLEHGSLLSTCCLLGCKSEQGLAPSRSQLVEQALANIPLLAPEDVKAYLNTILASSDRSQRRWLAKFRRRWGARLGMLKPCSTSSLKEKQSKVRKEVLGCPKCSFVSISRGLFLGPFFQLPV